MAEVSSRNSEQPQKIIFKLSKAFDTPDSAIRFTSYDPGDKQVEQKDVEEGCEVLISSDSQLLNPFRWTVFQKHAETVQIEGAQKGLIVSPRNENETIQHQLYENFDIHNDLNTWLNFNLRAYLDNKSKWSQRVPPKRFLYLFGSQGNGKSTAVAKFCKEMGVNLLFVKSLSRHNTYFPRYTEFAKQHQPCLIFYDNASYITQEEHVAASFVATIQGDLNSRLDDVWIVLSNNSNPNTVPSSIKSIIASCGEVAYVPVLESVESRKQFILTCLKTVSSDVSYPHRSDQPGSFDWNIAVNDMAMCSESCTMREIYDFIVSVFLRVYRVSRMKQLVPTVSDFKEAVSRLPRRMEHMRHSESILVTRNVEKDKQEYHDMWNNYARVNSIKDPSPLAPYSPSNTLDEYCPSTPKYIPSVAVFDEEYQNDTYVPQHDPPPAPWRPEPQQPVSLPPLPQMRQHRQYDRKRPERTNLSKAKNIFSKRNRF